MGENEQEQAERTEDEQGTGDEGAARAREQEKDTEKAKEEIRELEEQDEPPENLEDWPSGRAKYITYGGPEGTQSYDEGPTRKLGPSSLQHHSDGSVTIEGEEVDDPEEYKGDPIPGGPTDPNAPDDPSGLEQENTDDDGDEGGGDDGDEGGDDDR
jgi:hypothetical protein